MVPRLIRPAASRQLIELPFRSAFPCRASFARASTPKQLHTTHQQIDPEPLPESFTTPSEPRQSTSDPLAPKNRALKPPRDQGAAHSPRYDLSRAPTKPRSATPASDRQQPLELTPTLRETLPNLTSQPPFYATIHIHGKPYLVTTGDAIRLPFLMHGVLPGDVLRLDRASRLGSRNWTLVAGATTPSTGSVPTTVAPPIIGKTDGLPPDTPYPASSDPQRPEVGAQAGLKRKGPPAYLDDRLFIVRAVVIGTESEPMRIMEKTKRRQRHTKHVKSKHRFTMLRIREVTIKSLAELEAEQNAASTEQASSEAVLA